MTTFPNFEGFLGNPGDKISIKIKKREDNFTPTEVEIEINKDCKFTFTAYKIEIPILPPSIRPAPCILTLQIPLNVLIDFKFEKELGWGELDD